jgi:Zn-dependent M16 (insulinase) family peptidase
MTAASSHVRPVSQLNHELTGLAGIEQLKQLDNALDDSASLDQLVTDLQSLQAHIAASNPRLLLVCDSGVVDSVRAEIDSVWGQYGKQNLPPAFVSEFDAGPVSQAWVTTSQVNFCASAFATVPENHADAPALSVLAGVLRNGFLHKVVREQGGAYGGGAGHDSSNGIFRFYSYRDPNLMATFDAFQRAVDWVLDEDLGFELIEESSLGIVGSLDAPGSPAGEARQAYHNDMFGRDADHRRQVRQSILRVGTADIKRVAAQYLQGAGARAVVCHDNSVQALSSDFAVRSI